MALRGSELIEKRNVLNEIRSNNMTIQELRFFSIYLSKINSRDVSTRKVQFSLEDFCKIMNFGRPNIKQLQSSTNSLLCKVVNIPKDDGGYEGFTLFKKCRVFKNEYEKWYIEIDASDDALPLMFEFKNRYFTYELWNALRLKSPNQVRMYEILKQYEKIGKRELSIKDLRELLGISPNEYAGRTGWSDFKRKVLDACQQALKETTDICFDYERGRAGAGGKWLTIIFHIKKNEDYVDQLTLAEFIDMQDSVLPEMKDVGESFEEEEEEDTFDDTLYYVKHREVIDAYREYADDRMTDKGIVAFDNAAQHYYPYDGLEERAIMFNNCLGKAEALAKEPIKNLNSYILKVLENGWKNG